MHFLGYDKSGLDAQYNLRAAVPDYQNYFDQWDRRSKQARNILRNRLDVAYGSNPFEVLDIFFADQDNAPVAVFIHGGYWQRLDKSQFSYIAEGFAHAGVTVVVMNYSLAPGVGMDEIVQQNREALAWIWRHAQDHQCNPNRIHVCGHSAGGHLTAVLAATNWLTFGQDLPQNLIKGICAISGIFDLEPIRLCYLNEVLGMDATVSKRNSPIYDLPQKGMPLILAVGELETDEFHRQAQTYAECWRSKGFPLEVIQMAGFHHFSIVDELAHPRSPLNQAVLGQIHGSQADDSF
jgi:arylformamidase